MDNKNGIFTVTKWIFLELHCEHHAQNGFFRFLQTCIPFLLIFFGIWLISP